MSKVLRTLLLNQVLGTLCLQIKKFLVKLCVCAEGALNAVMETLI